jgi:type II secretory pathway pseudopilin PulG
MKKYYTGLLLLGLLTVGLLIFTVVQGSAQKQDKETERKSREISTKLNTYVGKNRRIPESLDEAGIKDVPKTISYTKESDSKYKFCETYKNKSSYGGDGITSLLWGTALQSYDDTGYDDYSGDDSYRRSSLYPSYSHDKGENCQTVEPYFSNNYNQYPTSSSSSSTTVKARDTERQTDIKALHSQIEAYYAQNGKYPTLVNLNTASFVSTNLKGLDTEALKDPVGRVGLLTSTPSKNYYSYAVTGNGKACDNVTTDCDTYTLTATLEAGGTYTKNSLN